MKKFLALTAVLAICLSAAGCTAKKNDNNTNSDMIDSTNYRVGIGSYTTTQDSSPSVEGENGKGVVSTTYATVVFDENNIIKKVYIDEVQSKIYFDGNGQLVNNDSYREIRSKRELGNEYGMKAASGIGKEWFEQINSIESWLVGKNIAEISDGVMNMGGYGTNGDYADNVVNGAENDMNNMAEGVADGAKSIINGITDGARNIVDGTGGAARNAENNTTTDGTNTAEGISNDSNPMTDNNADNITGDTQPDSTPPAPDRTDDNGNSTMTNSANALDWKEDLKASVTIDLTNIQRALHKAYINAK